jgi:hypothetical protein
MTNRSKFMTAAAVFCMICLTACGNTKGERALSGAGIGAGIGAVGSAVTGGSPWTGAVVGGAAGAATGALTDKDDIDFGD